MLILDCVYASDVYTNHHDIFSMYRHPNTFTRTRIRILMYALVHHWKHATLKSNKRVHIIIHVYGQKERRIQRTDIDEIFKQFCERWDMDTESTPRLLAHSRCRCKNCLHLIACCNRWATFWMKCRMQKKGWWKISIGNWTTQAICNKKHANISMKIDFVSQE